MNLLLMFCDFVYHGGNSFHAIKLNTEITLLLQMGQSSVSGLSVIFHAFLLC